jgi:1-deoxy-D-xylulose-5-phosphate reductoisomerase
MRPAPRQRVLILGATGSVGTSTLDVIARHPDRFEVFALTAQHRVNELRSQCLQWKPRFAVVADAAQANSLQAALRAEGVGTAVMHGPQALVELAAHPEVHSVMAAIVGAAGLPPCIAAARAGKRLMLANKEALVVGGAVFMSAVREGGALLLPIDSEHSAIFQCLPEDRSAWPARIDHIVLTASGGPFRGRSFDSLHEVTPDEACAHPNWVMGRKISVDSATMMNKALEVIEARWLFDLAPAQIRVLIHPQSTIHSMVVCRDNSVLAQLGTPDMRVPIAYGLSFPQRVVSGASALDFESLKAMTFEPADAQRYPSLHLSWAALQGPAGASIALNAANEVAVAAFLAGRIRFTSIHGINADTMAAQAGQGGGLQSLGDILAFDEACRARAQALVEQRARP